MDETVVHVGTIKIEEILSRWKHDKTSAKGKQKHETGYSNFPLPSTKGWKLRGPELERLISYVSDFQDCEAVQVSPTKPRPALIQKLER